MEAVNPPLMSTETTPRPGVWPFVAIGMAVCLFANAFPAVKVCLGALTDAQIENPAFAFLPIRFLPAAIFYLILCATVLRRESIALLREHPWRMILAGFAVVFGYNIFFNLGEEQISPGVSALIIASGPIQTLLLSIPLLKDRIHGRQLTGVIIGFAGIFIVARYGQGQSVTDAKLIGAALTILAPTMWALYTIFLKPVFKRHNALTVTGVTIVIGTIPVLIFARPAAFAAIASQPLSLGSWLFLSFGATVLAFYLWNVPLKYISPTALAVFVYFIPLGAVTFSILFWKNETFNWWLALGGATIIVGVTLANDALWNRAVNGRTPKAVAAVQ